MTNYCNVNLDKYNDEETHQKINKVITINLSFRNIQMHFVLMTPN